MSGNLYLDLKTTPTVPNAVSLYQKLTINSVRQIPNYKINVVKNEVEVE